MTRGNSQTCSQPLQQNNDPDRGRINPQRQRPNVPLSSYFVGGLLAAAVCLLFALLWWNRFFAVTNEGWHFFFAHQIANGKLPYRDFYLFVPPLLQLEMAATIKVFGEHLIASQVVGLFEIAILAFALYAWMARLFPATYAFFGTLSSVLLCMANRTEALNALHLTGMFYAVLAGTIATLSVNSERTHGWFAFAGGIFAALALLGKQNSGIAAVVGLPFVLGIGTLWLHGFVRAAKLLLRFFLGCGLPLFAVGTWLARNGALRQALADTFLRGASSKGSKAQMILRIFSMTWDNAYMFRSFVLAAVILAGFLILNRKRLGSPSEAPLPKHKYFYSAALLFAAMILLGWVLSYRPNAHLRGMLVHLPDFGSAFLAWLGSLTFFVIYSWRLLTKGLRRDQVQNFMLAGFSFAMAFMNSLSWPTNPITLVPAFAFIVATMLDTVPNMPQFRWQLLTIEAACLIGILQVSYQKCASPYEWGGWREPDIHVAHVRLDYPELRGYRVSPQTAQFLARVTQEIDSHSTTDDRLYVFPNLPIFYLLSHRQPETFAYVHYIDVSPDFIDAADADTLGTHPPKVIVSLKYSEDDLRTGEIVFRGGHRSGQRDLIAAMAALRPNYQLLDTIPLPGTDRTVEVLVRR